MTAVDLSRGLLDECHRRLVEAGVDEQVHLIVADARDLQAVTDTDFDAVLLMGPLYHLIEESDRIEALQQAIDRLKSGGLLVSASISRLGLIGDLMSRSPEWIERRNEVQAILKQGYNPDNPRQGGFRGYFARIPEIIPLHERLGLQTLVLAGVEPAIAANDAIYNRLQGKQRELWLELLFGISRDESIIGASRHLIYIGQKRAI